MALKDSAVAGTLLFVGGVQFVLALILAEAVYPGYSVSANYISDLGVWGRPSAPVFNPSTMIFGLTVLASSYFIFRSVGHRGICAFIAVAGLGALGVGVFPENTFEVHGTPVLHSISALLAFLFGGVSAIAVAKITKPPFRYISAVLGAFALVSYVVLISTRNLGSVGVGAGALERMVACPTLLWTIGFGGYLLSLGNEK